MKPLLGISLKVISALVFTLMSATLKTLTTRYPVGEVVFFRSAFALLPLLVWLAWQGDLINSVRTRNLGGHIKRGLIGTAGMYLGFAALSYLPLHDSIAIGYASPLIVVILAAVLLKEKVRAYRWSAVGIGFVGVLIMLSPYLKIETFTGGFDGGPSLGALFALLGAFCSAGAMIQVRRLTATEKTGAIVFYFFILASVLSLFTIFLGWRVPDATDMMLFVVGGILGGIGQILLTQSYRFADTSIIAPFEYTTMIWALLFGWFMFGDLPTSTMLTGATIVAGTGLFIVWREHQLGLMRAQELKAASPKPVG
ncbi:DMT family transporter [Microvirga subterranea]|uniref:Drug/metabolite transporter (DMT)-like permease n=1 Tax=Microvirga subterranea TaxID=186651 RepID=A0A370HV89_9HYPH|nr:DMT family transporter [Microvirga subterranea]RDI60854.1 drug/metabolite transporter (DMT)-like permease [Microvirga subterranea]